MQVLPKLLYSYDALEPYIDAKTMEIHYSKHHATYVNKLNEGLQNYPELQTKTVLELLKNLDDLPEGVRGAVRNHGGGHYNHSLFWTMMKKDGGGEASGKLADAIRGEFGDFAKFKEVFTKAALGQFGSGWAWLVSDSSGKLSVVATPNQDSPVSQGLSVILGLDVWEHSYYLKYQNRRNEYVESWWMLVDWGYVGSRLEMIRS